MKKLLFTLFAAMLMPLLTMAQDENKAAVDDVVATTDKAKKELTGVDTGEKPWKFSGVVSLNMSATGLWNWAAGGNNSAVGIAAANLTLTYHKNKFAWVTNLDTEFGESWVDKNDFAWQKSNDKIVFTTKFGYEFHKDFYLTLLGGFRSQYAPGYDYTKHDDVWGMFPVEQENGTMLDMYGMNAGGAKDAYYISNWLLPSYTEVSLGIDWMREFEAGKGKGNVSLYLSPAAMRLTTALTDSVRIFNSYMGTSIAHDENGNLTFGDGDKKLWDRKYKVEAGLTFRGNLDVEPVENLKLMTSLAMFTPYSKDFGNFDVDWDVALSYQFLKVLNVKLGYTLKYYDKVLIDGHHKVQSKLVLGLGVGYSF